MKISIVWFKKDLRINDHRAFVEASRYGYVVPLYVYEPEIINADDYDSRHHQFINDSLTSLNNEVKNLGGKLELRHDNILNVFINIKKKYNQFKIFSHQETGNKISFKRDLDVMSWCKNNKIVWQEYTQNGVQRPIKSRDGWSYEWNKYMNQPILDIPQKTKFINIDNNNSMLNLDKIDKIVSHTNIQIGGRKVAIEYLTSFLNERGHNYTRELSSPLTAITSCSRLSPYFTYGNISLREVFQITKLKRESLKSVRQKGNWKSSYSSFLSRLRWHCHFIQKLEDQPNIEWINMARVYDGIREDSFNNFFFEAWKEGKTGYPLVDACMRFLKIHGYINFRMRAMIVSFASYDLWLDWRITSKYLATQFTDYEPGIHYSQFQMQSGVTGINSIRIYNPIKQQMDHDPEGKFVKEWVPELRSIPNEYIFTPHLMSLGFQKKFSCIIGSDYPLPVVDHMIAVKKAKKILYSIKSKKESKLESSMVFKKHGSRRKRPST